MRPTRCFSLYLATLLFVLTSWTVTPASAVTEVGLHAFVGSPLGDSPLAGLLQDSAGNLYGTTSLGGAHGLGSVFELTPDGQGGYAEKVLHSFTNTPDGYLPATGLIMDSVGNLYGTTEYGGTYGTVFELSPSTGGSWTETVLHTFTGGPDGQTPLGQLALDAAGNLYGTTSDLFGQGGTVFELSPGSSGWTETILHTFHQTDGYEPVGGLVVDAQGNVYGTTLAGGSGGDGTVFELQPSGSGFQFSTIFNFTGANGDGPDGNLLIDAQGNLFGVTEFGGQAGYGTVFELTIQSGKWTATTLYAFHPASDGRYPTGGVTFDTAGNLYGTTSSGGGFDTCDTGIDVGCGTVFELTPNGDGTWSEVLLHRFGTGRDGALPMGAVLIGSQGEILGTSSLAGPHGRGTVFQLTAVSGGYQESIIDPFPANDGAQAYAPLVFDAAGNLYGTTYNGGTEDCSTIGEVGCGAVFELSPLQGGWKKTLLYSFKGHGDGANPAGGLVFDAAGNLYGTTYQGGTGTCMFSVHVAGCGTVFELSPPSVSGGPWTEQVLYSFAGDADGSNPWAGVVLDGNGNLYGTTVGDEGLTGQNYGTVFELSPIGGGQVSETVLHRFVDSDGSSPYGGVILDAAGNLYGTAASGSGGVFEGDVFELVPSSGGTWTFNVLYAFTGGSDLGYPMAGVVLDSAGNLYGTGAAGGKSYGGVFELSQGSTGQWTETTLHAFNKTDGEYPYGGVALDAAGNVYGTNYQGGSSTACVLGCGTLFQLTPSSGGTWTETILHTFNNGTDGSKPEAALILDGAGNLYGTTTTGGDGNAGVVYEITLP